MYNIFFTSSFCKILQYSHPNGLLDLRQAIAEKLLFPKGIHASTDDIAIVAGGLETMNLVCQVFINPGDIILVEAPTFVQCAEIFEMFQAKCVSVEMDDNGIVLEDLEQKIQEYHPKIIYVIPTFQNPSGRTLSVERRKAIAELGSKYDVLVLEDDPYRELRYSGEDLPPIKYFDKTGHTIYANSLSKIFSPGARLGFVYAAPQIISKLFDAKTATNSQTNGIAQVLCAEFFKRGYFEPHLEKIRGKDISMIFQDPMTALNPVFKVGDQIAENIMQHEKVSKKEAMARALELLTQMGIPEPEKRINQYPHEFSGGMRQRAVIALAMSCNPKVLLADEPTTALDVTIQAQILDLIKALKVKYDLTTIYITHDLGVVANVADRIAVMYAGDIVEIGTCEEVFYDPKHPYTWALLSSLPQLGVKGEDLYAIKGTPPNLFNTIHGDAFAPRNPHALKIDFVARPPYFEVSPTHKARTWLLDPRAPKVEPPEIIKHIRDIKRGGADNG